MIKMATYYEMPTLESYWNSQRDTFVVQPLYRSDPPLEIVESFQSSPRPSPRLPNLITLVQFRLFSFSLDTE